MSVKTIRTIALLFKDSRATAAERVTMRSAFKRDPELNVMSVKAKATMDALRSRAAANRAAAS